MIKGCLVKLVVMAVLAGLFILAFTNADKIFEFLERLGIGV